MRNQNQRCLTISSSTLTGNPSIYLNELMVLATKTGVNNDIIWHKFIQAILINIRAAQTNLEMEILGKLAENLMLYFNKQCPSPMQPVQPKIKNKKFE